jgi:hypothetical protein
MGSSTVQHTKQGWSLQGRNLGSMRKENSQ